MSPPSAAYSPFSSLASIAATPEDEGHGDSKVNANATLDACSPAYTSKYCCMQTYLHGILLIEQVSSFPRRPGMIPDCYVAQALSLCRL